MDISSKYIIYMIIHVMTFRIALSVSSSLTDFDLNLEQVILNVNMHQWISMNFNKYQWVLNLANTWLTMYYKLIYTVVIQGIKYWRNSDCPLWTTRITSLVTPFIWLKDRRLKKGLIHDNLFWSTFLGAKLEITHFFSKILLFRNFRAMQLKCTLYTVQWLWTAFIGLKKLPKS